MAFIMAFLVFLPIIILMGAWIFNLIKIGSFAPIIAVVLMLGIPALISGYFTYWTVKAQKCLNK